MGGRMSQNFRQPEFRKGHEMNHLQENSGGGRFSRRDVLAGAAAIVVGSVSVRAGNETPRAVPAVGKIVKNGRIKQSICGGVLAKARLDREQTAKLLVEMGLVGRDLVGPAEWPVLKQYGLVATMVPGAGSIKKGINDKSMHAQFLEDFKKNIQAAAEYKWPNVITLAGDRAGISDAEGMDNCQAILKEAVKIAEDSGVTICMELLNTKRGHTYTFHIWA
jgi:hydroxypyruvate isomerase